AYSAVSYPLFLHISLHTPNPTLFPYTTLFRSRAARSILPLAVMGRASSGTTAEGTMWSGRVAARAARTSSGSTRVSGATPTRCRSEEHTSELQSRENLVCRLLLEKKNKKSYV